ncbi:tyrosine-type recombinase/integrase [Nocardioides yefusunii]|uniref:Tyrosine-type recombinase/integrase n=1 Tax=Nocardioides yefusunii TaxID=2500546 RepID=A0ABW1R0B8_9ACTN|nr:tyrosine-type recombinase/integrase [Nocardioides yefusunii]
MLFTDPYTRPPENWHPDLDEMRSISDIEGALHIPAGTPIIVSPSLELDDDLCHYFSSALSFTDLAPSTRRSRAHAIKTWLDFLDSQGLTDWRSAHEDLYADFRRWRTNPNLPGSPGAVVSEESFEQTRVALRALYDWAVKRRLAQDNPIPSSGPRASKSSAAVKHKNWLNPRAYRLWKAVGIQGHRARIDGSEVVIGGMDTTWRGQLEPRNTAMVDLLVTTGMRIGEACALTSWEVLQEAPGRYEMVLPAIITKSKRDRPVRVSPGTADVQRRYIKFRDAAIRRAQRGGLYEDLEWRTSLLVAQSVEPSGSDLLLNIEGRGRVRLSAMGEDQRQRLYARGRDGALEPLSWFLTERGTPTTPDTWTPVFASANERLLAQAGHLGLNPHSVPEVTPHTLRHTFALWLLAAEHRSIDRGLGLSGVERYDVKRYERAFDRVKEALGHAHVGITKDTYLAPVRTLRMDDLLSGTEHMEIEDVIARLANPDLVYETKAVRTSDDA